MRPVVDPRVLERLVDGEIGVLKFHVLADERDLDLTVATPDALNEVVPLAEVGLDIGKTEPVAHQRVEALIPQGLRHEVDVAHILVCDDRLGVDVGEERDLLPDVAGEWLVRAADHDVGVDTMRRSSLTECCVGFVFSSPAVSMKGTNMTCR